MRTDLARLESAFPAFSFTICNGWGGPRIEAWRDTTLSGLYAIITDDPASCGASWIWPSGDRDAAPISGPATRWRKSWPPQPNAGR